MNEDDYIFLKYIDRFYNNRFLSLLLNDYEKGISMLKRKQIKQFVNEKEETKKAENLLFLYILFKKRLPNKYIHELQKHLSKNFHKLTLKEGRKTYKLLKEILSDLNVDPLEVNPQVINNVRKYIID